MNNRNVTVTVMGRGGKATGPNKDYFNVRYPDNSTGGIFLNSIEWSTVEPPEEEQVAGQAEQEAQHEAAGDQQGAAAQDEEEEPCVQNEEQMNEVLVVMVPRSMHNAPEVLQAKLKELKNYRDFQVYEVVPDVGQPRIRHNWIVTQKPIEGGGVCIKARLCARGDEEWELLRTDSPTVDKKSLRIIYSIAAQYTWKCESGDIRAAFLQGERLERDLYIVPPAEAKEGNNLWKLLKPIYGLNDASRKFYLKLVEKIIQLGCKRSKYDYAVFYFHRNSLLEGVIGGHVDDLTYAGTDFFFKNVIDPLKREFRFGACSVETFKYVGWRISHSNNKIFVDQNEYIDDKAEEISINPARLQNKEDEINSKERTELRRLIGRARWVTDQTRPDLAYDGLEMSVVANKATVNDLLRANKMIKKMRAERITLVYQKLGNPKDLKLTVFTDASFANLPDKLSSAGGYIVLLTTGFKPGQNTPCCPLSWQSCKVKRKVTNTMEAETLTLREGMEEAIILQNKYAELINVPLKNIRIEAFTDNDDCWKAIYSSKQLLKGRIAIDMGAIKDMVEKKEVEHVQWLSKDHQLADSLTKRDANTKSLFTTLVTGRFPRYF